MELAFTLVLVKFDLSITVSAPPTYIALAKDALLLVNVEL